METTILNVIYSHRDTWKCFGDHPTYSVFEGANTGEKRHLPQITFKHSSIVTDKYETRQCYPVQPRGVIVRYSAQIDSLIKGITIFVIEFLNIEYLSLN